MAAVITYNSEVELRWQELTVNGVHYVGFKAPDAIAANLVWVLPTADGFNGFALVTNGTGTLSWAISGEGLLAGNNVFTGTQNFSNVTASTSAATGAVRINGGLGVLLDVFVGGRIRSTSPTLGIGYATGAGGAVTQATDKSTGVTLNTVCGQITMNAAALSDATTVSFIVTNAAVAIGDRVIVNHDSAGTAGAYQVQANNIGSGTFNISVRNESGGPLSEAIVVGFSVVKGVMA